MKYSINRILFDLLGCAPKLHIQLVLLIVYTSLIFPITNLIAWSIVKPFISRLPRPVINRYAKYNKQYLKSGLFVDVSIDDAFLNGIFFTSVLFIHLIGAVLSCPSALGLKFVPTEIAYCMARHGALSEAAWELKDFIERAYQILFLKNKGGGNESKLDTSGKIDEHLDNNGDEKQVHLDDSKIAPVINPTSLLIILALHHSFGLSMIIPMNIFWGNNQLYHELVFLLLGCAVIGVGVQQYTFTLNIDILSQLRLMVILSLITWTCLFYGRILRFISIVFELIMVYQVCQNCSLGLNLGLWFVVFLIFSFNLLTFVDSSKRLIKFSSKLFLQQTYQTKIR